MAPATKKRKTTHEAARYLCSTCATGRLARFFPDYNPSPDCEHLINTCAACLKKWVTTQIEGGTLITGGDDEKVFGVKCPECDGVMRNVNVQIATTKKTYNRFEELERKHIADTTPGWRWCLNPQCRAGQVHNTDLPKEMQSKGKKHTKQGPSHQVDICTCNECGAMACVPCDRPYHTGETCIEYQARIKDRVEEEDKTLLQIQIKTKPCPVCNKRIEKNGGCPMMFCTQCSGRFCWNCGETFKNGCGCDRQRNQARAS